MTESKFLCFVLTESILLIVLGLGMLILPKITMISFGFMICTSFVIYGGYKMICSVLTRNLSRHYILDIITGLFLFADGIILFFAPVFDVMLIIGLAGIYFILKSLSSSAFAVQTRKTLNFWWMCLFLAVFEMLFGLLIIVTIPSGALWLVGIFSGLDFLLTGIVLMNMYLSTKYVRG